MRLAERLNPRTQRLPWVVVILAITAGVIVLVRLMPVRRPVSIFDAPVDHLFGYMSEEEFNRLALEERLGILRDVMARFSGANADDASAASAFLAGLTGPAMERLANNARLLGRDVLLEGADGWLALPEPERDAYIDQWVVRWIRFANEARGRPTNRTDQEVLDRASRQANRDRQRVPEVTASMAQEVIDFWRQDIEPVASPMQQAKLFQFLPAVRDRLLERQTGSGD